MGRTSRRPNERGPFCPFSKPLHCSACDTLRTLKALSWSRRVRQEAVAVPGKSNIVVDEKWRRFLVGDQILAAAVGGVQDTSNVALMVSDRSNHHILEHTDNLILLIVGLVTVSNVLLDVEEDAVLGTNPISWDNLLHAS